jgi:hypothetical protein
VQWFVTELPPDFDWVTARKKCSALEVFEQLRQETKRNIDAFHEGMERPVCEVASSGMEVFVVARHFWGRRIAVRFILTKDEILIEGIGVEVNMTATLTLNDKGQCRLRVGAEELDRWQVLRRALEPLLFSAENR